MLCGSGFRVSENIYQELAKAISGYVEAAAGCGKTEAIVFAVKDYCTGKQLILTHTNAGVGALKKRFKDKGVDQSKYHIETISGWTLNWIRHYPKLSKYSGTLPLPQKDDWPTVYEAARRLFNEEFIQFVIRNSYAGIIVDEYQDCTIQMHDLIVSLKELLPCRVLGDPLQGIFDFNKQPLVTWDQVISDFKNNIGLLDTPYRWKNNTPLGRWLISIRSNFQNNKYPDFNGSPIVHKQVDAQRKLQCIISLSKHLHGSVCIIGSKFGNFDPNLVSALINAGFYWVEPNDLPKLGKFLVSICNHADISKKAQEAISFISHSFVGLGSCKNFVEEILKGKVKSRPRDPDRARLFSLYPIGYTHQLLLDLIQYLLSKNINCKRYESIACLKRTLEQHLENHENLLEIFYQEISKQKALDNIRPDRCLGTTLLLKGLEFDHAIILYNKSDKGWNNLKDLYVALTRGCKSVYLIEPG